MTVIKRFLFVLLPALTLAACTAWLPHHGLTQTASVVDYLYPGAKEPPVLTPTVTTLRPPVRVGVAFVPGAGQRAGLGEAEKTRLIEAAKASFAQHSYIGAIEIIPGSYMRPRGGFENLQQVARMFDVDVVVLLSYDQVQFDDSSALSLLYWTLIGAYVVHGDKYDIQTMVDASVFDVRSRKLLFRAPGTSRIKGIATLAGFSEAAREARTAGYQQAIADLLPRLQTELDGFRERIRGDAGFKVERRDGSRGGGAMDGLGMLIAAVLAIAAWRRRAR
jgi:rhombotail lipoprotein